MIIIIQILESPPSNWMLLVVVVVVDDDDDDDDYDDDLVDAFDGKSGIMLEGLKHQQVHLVIIQALILALCDYVVDDVDDLPLKLEQNSYAPY